MGGGHTVETGPVSRQNLRRSLRCPEASTRGGQEFQKNVQLKLPLEIRDEQASSRIDNEPLQDFSKNSRKQWVEGNNTETRSACLNQASLERTCDSFQNSFTLSSPQVVPKRSSQSEVSRKTSSKSAQPEGRGGEIAQLANIRLQTKLLGLCSHDPLVGVVVRDVPGKASAPGVEDFEVTTATSTGLIRTCSLHLPSFWENKESLRQSTCLLKSQIFLPTRLSCICTAEHAALGSAILAGSEGGVVRCLNLANSELVKEIKVAEEPIRGLAVCPEVVENHEGSSLLLLGALISEDTLAFLRVTCEGSSLSSSTFRDLVVLGTLAVPKALGLHMQDANRGRPRRNRLSLHAEADEMRVMLRKDVAWIQHPEASLSASTRWLLACGNILRLEEPPLNVLFFVAAPSRSSLPRNEDLSDTCLLRAAKLDVCPACLCVVAKGIYVGTALGEIVCFDFVQLWNDTTRPTDLDALIRSPPASPLCCIAVASSLLRSLASPSVSSASLPPPAVAPLAADTCLLLATSAHSRVHAVSVPRLPQREIDSGGDESSVANSVAKDAATSTEKAPPSKTEGRTRKNLLCRVLWTRDLCGDAGGTDISVTSAVAFPLQDDVRFLVATIAGRDGLLIWKSSLSGQESKSDRSSSAAQTPCGLACEVHRTPPIAWVQPSPSLLETRAARKYLGCGDASMELWKPDPAVEAHMTSKETSHENVQDSQESREAVAAEMRKIREALAVLVAENETRASAESLPREAFCLDEEEREKIAGDAAREKQRLWQEHQLHALAFEALRDRLIEKFWKQLKRHGRVLASLADGNPELVRDFSVSHVPVEQAKIDKKVCFLRKLEKREKAWLRKVEVADKSLLQMKVEEPLLLTPWLDRMQEEYISHAWVERDSQAPYSASGATTATEGALEQTGGLFSEDDPRFQHVKELRSLLYPPLQVLSMSRRRLQSCLLNQVASALRDAFNQMFDAVAMDKKRTVEQINQRAKLASAIAAELKCAQKVAAYTSPACEDPEALLKVTEEDVLSELGFVPSWLSSGENNEEGKEEDSNACIDEASARALQQMMDGQLNSKKDMNVLEIKLEKEAWMDEVKPEDMTETQKKKVAEFERQTTQLAALQEAYRKKQEGNLLRVK